MIREDYVSFETAKLLKEKGFDWRVTRSFFEHDNCYAPCGPSEVPRKDAIAIPTLQMAMKWLREDKKLSIIIDICFDDDRNNTSGYFFDIWYLAPPYDCFDTPIHVFDTYEEACEAAIKYCLENLV